jgi:hypothetical protein
MWSIKPYCERDPQTVDDIFESEHADEWKQAMADDIKAHLDNKTWVLSDVPEGRRPIKCKCVFKTKLTADGQIERFKARLVAKGCSQQPGVDFDETYSPGMRYTSARFLLALVAKSDLDIDQMDVVTAFMHPELDEEIYMELPNDNYLKGATCRLQKSIYSLKQASRVWNMKLTDC